LLFSVVLLLKVLQNCVVVSCVVVVKVLTREHRTLSSLALAAKCFSPIRAHVFSNNARYASVSIWFVSTSHRR